MQRQALIDPREFDISKPVLTREQIRECNEQRYEMEMLDGVVLRDVDRKLIVGFLKIDGNAWWARGHFPGRPILPGVLALEAGGQLCSVYFKHLYPELRMGLARMDARIFFPIEPPGVLLIAGTMTACRKGFATFELEAYYNNKLAIEASCTGAPI
jgi:3-hydroxyacyl-[acyl-carrier-protein] dehydratase